MSVRSFATVLSVVAATVVFSGVRPAPSAQRADDKRSSTFAGRYFGQMPPGTVPQRFAPAFISTAGYDITPTFSPALDEVFFGYRSTEQGSDNKIYHSRMVNGRWTQPALASFSSGGMEFEAQFSVDGDTLYFNRGSALVFSQRTPTGWSDARQLPPPVDAGMCVAAAGNGTLYFTSARRPGIVRCRRADGTYQAPEVVVSPGAHPWVAPDESYLVFDRYAFAGGRQTGSKLFVSFRRKDESWSEPVELGPDINATGTELIPKVSPDGKYLFFQRKVDGNTDIYWVDARVIGALRSKDLR